MELTDPSDFVETCFCIVCTNEKAEEQKLSRSHGLSQAINQPLARGQGSATRSETKEQNVQTSKEAKRLSFNNQKLLGMNFVFVSCRANDPSYTLYVRAMVQTCEIKISPSILNVYIVQLSTKCDGTRQKVRVICYENYSFNYMWGLIDMLRANYVNTHNTNVPEFFLSSTQHTELFQFMCHLFLFERPKKSKNSWPFSLTAFAVIGQYFSASWNNGDLRVKFWIDY